MNIELRGHRYITILCSDIDTDGMYLEVREITDEGEIAVADVFYSDQRHDMVFSAYRESIPLEVLEWLLEQARTRLPPQVRSGS
jgi:hypothetical protein